jgi:hypothetical protein
VQIKQSSTRIITYENLNIFTGITIRLYVNIFEGPSLSDNGHTLHHHYKVTSFNIGTKITAAEISLNIQDFSPVRLPTQSITCPQR